MCYATVRKRSENVLRRSRDVGKWASPASKTVGECATPLKFVGIVPRYVSKTSENVLRQPCIVGKCAIPVLKTAENVLRQSRNFGECATPIMQRRRMCYADHDTAENVLRRSRNVKKGKIRGGEIKKMTLRSARIVGTAKSTK